MITNILIENKIIIIRNDNFTLNDKRYNDKFFDENNLSEYKNLLNKEELFNILLRENSKLLKNYISYQYTEDKYDL